MDVASPQAPLRVAIVGAGVMGQRHARVIASLPELVSLVGIADADAGRAAALAAPWGAQVFPSASEAIREADAVIIAASTGVHHALCLEAICAGRPVLVEKPLAATLHEALEIHALSHRRRVPVFVGHSERFNPAIRHLRRSVPAQTISSLHFVRQGPARNRTHPAEGVIGNLGVHDFDLLAYLTDSVPKVEWASSGKAVARDFAEVSARTVSGVEARLIFDRRPARWTRRIEVVASGERYVGDLVAGTLTHETREGSVMLTITGEDPLTLQAAEWVRGCLGQRPPTLATAADGVQALRLVEQAETYMHSARERGVGSTG